MTGSPKIWDFKSRVPRLSRSSCSGPQEALGREWSQYLKYIGHVCLCPNAKLTKKMLFATSRRPYKRDPWINIAKLINVPIEQAKRSTQGKSGFAALVDRVFAIATPW